MNTHIDTLNSPDLEELLRALPPQASERIGRVIVAHRRKTRLRLVDLRLEWALDTQQLTGHLLIPDILEDLRTLTRYPLISAPGYRNMLQTIAQRHDIQDDGNRPAASVERDLQSKYKNALWPDADMFRDLGHTPLWRRVASFVPPLGLVAYALSPSWQVATAAVLEIAAHRRIAIARGLRANMES